jgi:uncharacterized OB-fold protein
MINEAHEDYSQCLKCGGVVETPPMRFCKSCFYPGIHDDYQEFIELIEAGHSSHQAAVMSGWMGVEEQ